MTTSPMPSSATRLMSVSSIGTSASSPSSENVFCPRNAARWYRSMASTLVRRSRRRSRSSTVSAGRYLPELDVLAQPHALLVARDVLDLEGDGAAVRRAEIREHLGEVATGDVDAQQVGGDLLHQLLGQAVRRRVHRRIADRRRAERVEVRAEMTVGPVRLDQRRRRLHRAEQDAIGCSAQRRSKEAAQQARGPGPCEPARSRAAADQAKAGENHVVEIARHRRAGIRCDRGTHRTPRPG